jgi:hypothetical protein
MLVGVVCLATESVESGSMDQSFHQPERLRPLTRQCQRCLAPLQGLLWIAQEPQDVGQTAEAKHLSAGHVKAVMRAVLQRQAEGKTLLQMCTGRVQLTAEE